MLRRLQWMGTHWNRILVTNGTSSFLDELLNGAPAPGSATIRRFETWQAVSFFKKANPSGVRRIYPNQDPRDIRARILAAAVEAIL